MYGERLEPDNSNNNGNFDPTMVGVIVLVLAGALLFMIKFGWIAIAVVVAIIACGWLALRKFLA